MENMGALKRNKDSSGDSANCRPATKGKATKLWIASPVSYSR